MPLDDHLKLAGDFPPATEDRWRSLVATLMSKGGAPLDADAAIAKLTSTTYDGIAIRPLYTSGPGATLPVASAAKDGVWQIRQVVHPRGDEPLALEELEKGATAVQLDLRNADTIDTDALTTVLRGVLLDLAPVALDAGPRWEAAARALLEVWANGGVDSSAATGVLGADPFGEHLSTGGAAGAAELDQQLAHLAALTRELAVSHPAVRVIAVDGTRLHDAGASDGQELGGVVAAGVAYLRLLVENGVSAGAAFAAMELRLAATADQFATIAKFRAIRILWGRVADVLGAPGAALHTSIHAATSRAMMTEYDPWVNLLRTTVACFAASAGGADSITVLPFDELVERSDSELGRRLARNTQSILAMESNLTRVVDPAGGSWYVERRTEQLAEAAWAWFQEIELAGGFREAGESGVIAARLAATWDRRARNVDTRRDPITGVSEFPDIREPMPHVRVASAATAAPTAFAPLPRHRPAERFEDLRADVDRVTASSGTRPSVFLAAIGSPAASTARLTFAKNFFEIAGVTTIAGPNTIDLGDIARAFTQSGARIACLCSSDPTYAECGVPVASALSDSGATRILVAGRPRDLTAQLDAAGVTGYIAVGCDVRATLTQLLDDLGVR
jgi:methylmalonyl-CoA mutase